VSIARESTVSIEGRNRGERIARLPTATSNTYTHTHSPVERVSGERAPSRAGVRWPVNSPIMQNYSPPLEPPFSSQPCDYLRNAYHRAYRGVSRARFARTHYTPVITRALRAPTFPLPIRPRKISPVSAVRILYVRKEKRHPVKAQPAFFTAFVSKRSIDPRQCRKC